MEPAPTRYIDRDGAALAFQVVGSGPADVVAYSEQVAKEIAAGRLPRLNFGLVGVGDQVDEEQMEGIGHEPYKIG